ncbi:retrotransposon protein [Hordeum vulgare]|nr:retrotransposon protein [Hordeum vulgare]
MLLTVLWKDLLMQVAPKLTRKEVWDSLNVCFVDANEVKAARLATLRGEFERLRMDDGDELNAYAGRVYGMTSRYAGLRATLDDATIIKKLLDTVPDRLYAAVAGIEQFYDVEKTTF